MSFVLDKAALDAELLLILSRMQDPIPFFDYVGKHEKHAIRERIMHTKLAPDGTPWIPWAPYTIEQRSKKGNTSQGIMWDTGTLLDSIKFEVDGTFGLDIGSDVWYAQKHQDGAGRIPKRPIFGWEEDMLLHYAQAFVRFLETGVA